MLSTALYYTSTRRRMPKMLELNQGAVNGLRLRGRQRWNIAMGSRFRPEARRKIACNNTIR